MRLRNLIVLAVFVAVAASAFQFSSEVTATTMEQPGVSLATALAQDPFLDGAEITAETGRLCGGFCIGNCLVPTCSAGCSCKFCNHQYDCFR